MKTREEIKEQAKSINGTMPGIGGATRILALVLELLLDIRDELKALNNK